MLASKARVYRKASSSSLHNIKCKNLMPRVAGYWPAQTTALYEYHVSLLGIPVPLKVVLCHLHVLRPRVQGESICPQKKTGDRTATPLSPAEGECCQRMWWVGLFLLFQRHAEICWLEQQQLLEPCKIVAGEIPSTPCALINCSVNRL